MREKREERGVRGRREGVVLVCRVREVGRDTWVRDDGWERRDYGVRETRKRDIQG